MQDFFVCFDQEVDFFNSQKTRFFPKTRFQKSINSILGHKLGPKNLNISPFLSKSCLQKVRKNEIAQKLTEKHKITSKIK